MLRELLARFNIDASQAIKELQGVDKKLEGAKSSLVSLGEAFVGSKLVGGLKDFVEGQIAAAREVRLTADKLGIGTEELEKFQFAAGTAGASAEGAATGLKFLNKNMGLALEGNAEAAQAFQKLGVSIKDGSGNVRELGDVIPEVADAFQHMGSQQERTTMAMKLFGRQGADLLPLLKQGSAGLKALDARFEELGGGMSEDFIVKAKDAGKALSGMRFGVEVFKRKIAYELFPTVIEFGTRMQGVIGFLNRVTKETHLAAEAAAILGAGVAAAGAKASVGMLQFLGVLPKGAGFWKTALGLFEIGLVVAGVLLLALLFEDFFSMLNGDESVIGDLIDEFLGLGTVKELVKELGDAWSILSGLFATDLGSLKPLVDLMKELGKSVIPYAVASFVDMVRVVAGLVVLFGAFVKGFAQLAQLDFEGVGKTIKATGALFAKGGLLGGSAVQDLAKRQEGQAANHDVTEALHTSGREGGNVTIQQSNKFDVKVEGGKDARETGDAVKDGLRDVVDTNLAETLGAVQAGG